LGFGFGVSGFGTEDVCTHPMLLSIYVFASIQHNLMLVRRFGVGGT